MSRVPKRGHRGRTACGPCCGELAALISEQQESIVFEGKYPGFACNHNFPAPPGGRISPVHALER
jgi:hypothetical protein